MTKQDLADAFGEIKDLIRKRHIIAIRWMIVSEFAYFVALILILRYNRVY